MPWSTVTAPGFRRRARAALSLVLAAGTVIGLSSCGASDELTAPKAAAHYPSIADTLAETLSTEITPMTSDDASPQVGTSSSGCRVTGAAHLSEDLLTDAPGEAPAEDDLIAVANPVLSEHGFSEIGPESDDPSPVRTLVATDGQGGAMRLVLESRPDRPTLRLWWSAQVDTDGADCTDELLG